MPELHMHLPASKAAPVPVTADEFEGAWKDLGWELVRVPTPDDELAAAEARLAAARAAAEAAPIADPSDPDPSDGAADGDTPRS